MDFWFTESQSAGLKLSHKVKKLIHKEQTPFQELSIVELEQYGRALILDDIVQTTIADEFVYHEMITHMPLNTHPNPQNVLIIYSLLWSYICPNPNRENKSAFYTLLKSRIKCSNIYTASTSAK